MAHCHKTRRHINPRDKLDGNFCGGYEEQVRVSTECSICHGTQPVMES